MSNTLLLFYGCNTNYNILNLLKTGFPFKTNMFIFSYFMKQCLTTYTITSNKSISYVGINIFFIKFMYLLFIFYKNLMFGLQAVQKNGIYMRSAGK